MFMQTLTQAILGRRDKSTYTFKLYLPTQGPEGLTLGWVPGFCHKHLPGPTAPREQIHNESCIWMKEEVEKAM